ncbi:MAG: ATP-binding cassette domain-containing protein [Bacteroidetes bacterium]|nr:ATP-binding cassette domain-containing protein [Bacteroidota bacterium]
MLKVESVSKHYAGKTALNNVSLEAHTGKIYGLLGPNGAGKTSLIRIITCITAPDSGSVYFNNEKMQSRLIREIGYLPEERGLYRKMTVSDQALYFGQLKGMAKSSCLEQMDFWFERLDMQSWRKKKLEELSKGMQQKVQFVLTVLHQPKLIILDEPFSGFDPINAELIKTEVMRLRDEGASILLSTHRMESVEELCDDISLINQGEVVLQGAVKEVRQKYKKSAYMIAYEGNLPAEMRGIQSMNHHQRRDGVIETTMFPEAGASLTDILQMVSSHVHLLEYREMLPSIKDIFIQLVGKSA